MLDRVIAIGLGFLLVAALGDPHGFPHPVRWIGRLISALEEFLRARFPKSPRGERTAGRLLALLTVLISAGAAWGLLWFSRRLLGRWAALAVETVLCYWLIAARSLRDESMKVHAALAAGDRPGARRAVSMIVGRDTAMLSEEGVAKAAVETVAENTGDGVVAPLFFLALGGAPLGFLYKTVNTLDSMVGYKNDRYQEFGRCSAKLDDLLNWIPARLSALLMIAAAALCGLDARGAARIWRRDRRNHQSPNSAQTEAACAGALGVRLAGDACYGGVPVKKPTIGDSRRAVEPEDIRRANRLMYGTSLLALGMFLSVKILILYHL